jgi:hypothetical protein
MNDDLTAALDEIQRLRAGIQRLSTSQPNLFSLSPLPPRNTSTSLIEKESKEQFKLDKEDQSRDQQLEGNKCLGTIQLFQERYAQARCDAGRKPLPLKLCGGRILLSSFNVNRSTSCKEKIKVDLLLAKHARQLFNIEELFGNNESIIFVLLDAPNIATTKALLNVFPDLDKQSHKIIITQADPNHYKAMIHDPASNLQVTTCIQQRLDSWLSTNTHKNYAVPLFFADYETTVYGKPSYHFSPLHDICRFLRCGYAYTGKEGCLIGLTLSFRAPNQVFCQGIDPEMLLTPEDVIQFMIEEAKGINMTCELLEQVNYGMTFFLFHLATIVESTKESKQGELSLSLPLNAIKTRSLVLSIVPPSALRLVTSFLSFQEILSSVFAASSKFGESWLTRSNGLERLNYFPTKRDSSRSLLSSSKSATTTFHWKMFQFTELHLGSGIPLFELATLLLACKDNVRKISFTATTADALLADLNLRELHKLLLDVPQKTTEDSNHSKNHSKSHSDERILLPLLFPKLVHFSCTNIIVNDISYFLRASNIQTMRTLSICRNNSFGNAELSALRQGCMLQAQSLTELRIESCPIDARRVIELLQCLVSQMNGTNSEQHNHKVEIALSTLSVSVGGVGAGGSHLDGAAILQYLSTPTAAASICLSQLLLQNSDLNVESVRLYSQQCGTFIERLNLGGRKTTDACIDALTNHPLPSMHTLSLCHSIQLTDVGIRLLSARCSSNLQILDLSWCGSGVTDKSIETLTDEDGGLPLLRELYVHHLKKISDRGLRMLLKTEKRKAVLGKQRHLVVLDARYCPSIFINDRFFLKAVKYARSEAGGLLSILLEGAGRI